MMLPSIHSTYLYGGLLLCMSLGVLCLPVSSMGQGLLEEYQNEEISPKAFSDSDWDQLQQELDYSGEPAKAKETPTASDDGSPPSSERRSPRVRFGDGTATAAKVVLFLVLAALFGWLIYRMLGQAERSNSDIGTEDEDGELISLERIEAHLDRTDVDPFIAKVEAQGAYHKAVRLHFLALLKVLNEKGWVHWKKEYTNRQYIQQMHGRPELATFRKLTRDYERTWYGDHHPDQAQYIALKEAFLQFRREIDQAIPEPV